MSKKILTILLTSCLTLSMLAGCGNKETTIEGTSEHISDETNINSEDINKDVQESQHEDDANSEPDEKEVVDETNWNEYYLNYFDSEQIFPENAKNIVELSINDNVLIMESLEFEDNFYMNVENVSTGTYAKTYYTPDKTYYDVNLGEEENFLIYTVNEEDMMPDTTSVSEEYMKNGEILEVVYNGVFEIDGCTYDLLKVKQDLRTDEEKEMLVYETPNGFMYLSEGVSMTLDDVKYGGEDGIQPLEEYPGVEINYSINRDTGLVYEMSYEENGTNVLLRFEEFDIFFIPDSVLEATEGSEEDVFTASFAILGIVFEFLGAGIEE